MGLLAMPPWIPCSQIELARAEQDGGRSVRRVRADFRQPCGGLVQVRRGVLAAAARSPGGQQISVYAGALEEVAPARQNNG